jgi:hypothetical protein
MYPISDSRSVSIKLAILAAINDQTHEKDCDHARCNLSLDTFVQHGTEQYSAYFPSIRCINTYTVVTIATL